MSEPNIVPAGAGEALWFLDTLMQVKLGAESARGTLAVFEQLAPAGSATPMHRHDATDEYFYVLSGAVAFHGPSGVRRCEAGTFVSVPRGTAHAFRVTDDGPARLLVLSAPATFERFVRAVSAPAPSATLPPAAAPPEPAVLAHLAALGAQHDVILLGPPPPAT
jgi:quercetin dioxygenase-like cupin family protein